MTTEDRQHFEYAKKELGIEEYNKHHRFIFDNLEVLDFVKTIVINLPGTCYANCPYCIDKKLISSTLRDYDKFLSVCEKVFCEFPDINEMSITGGSLPSDKFNELMRMIDKHYGDRIRLTWNTNGINIDSSYDISKFSFINLHRNSVDEQLNKKLFFTSHNILTIDEAKNLFGDKLCLRVTVDKTFDLDEYIEKGVSLYINRMLPINKEDNDKFIEVKNKLTKTDDSVDIRRRNVYQNFIYKGIKVRVCNGDTIAKRVAGKYPVYLNVAIIHRSGTVCGSWFEDDKVIYKNV